MKILFLGDIFGRPGRKTVKQLLPDVISEFKPDIILANVENIAGGHGVNRKTLKEMLDAGINVFTGGNHSFDNSEGNEVYDDKNIPVIRPANFPHGSPGKGWGIYTASNGERLLVISVMGRIFMPQHVDSPFKTIDEIFSQVEPGEYDSSIIDIHAEATSEKHAILWHYNGRVSAVVGTHTHIPTADADITPAGTAFQADAGMNGSLDSCIGLKSEQVTKKIMSQMPLKYELQEEGRMQFNAVLVETDGMRAVGIRHIRRIHK